MKDAEIAIKDFEANLKEQLTIAKNEEDKASIDKLIYKKNSLFFKLLELSLLENKNEFVMLLLENDINLTEFLTKDRLKMLYNNEVVSL